MISLLKLVLIFLTVFKSQSNAQNLVFELLDSEVNEVIFVGERDIVLNCSVRCVTNAVITIKSEESLIVMSAINVGYLEYNIEEVLLGDNGEYSCTVSYFDVYTGLNVTEIKTLHLNFKEEGPQCFRNGTVGEPFQVGDLLLMSCYCLEDDGCKWTSTIVGTGQAVSLESVNKTYRGKKIQRILKEYTIFTNTNTRYDCFKPLEVSSKFCSIGPQESSSEDTVVNSVPSNNTRSSKQIDCDMFQASNIPTMQPTKSDFISTTASNAGGLDPFLIGITTGGIGIFILLVLLVVCIGLKLGRLNKTHIKKHTDSEGHMYSNAAFDGHNGINGDLGSKNYSSKSQMSSVYDLPPMGKNHPDKPSEQDYYADVKKSGNGHVLYDFPPEGQDDYSYRERNGLSSNEAFSTISQSTATRGDKSSSHGNDSDLGYLYSQIDKKSGMSREKHRKNPDLEHVEGEEEFAQLYAKVDKNRRSYPKDASEKKVEQNNGIGDLYAEIDQR
ncbi:hypothetical protein HOLleu_28034 [Holothuria leucospilota]|uniref:Ig-like domain-containing protein n=1 Tax=Holothuria leucospilota TaxID=206669 RepID=A0A9Q1H2S1_HOLLE|nr:hypothetical protein HOLleu_28034 [Holothuria leucospilota]